MEEQNKRGACKILSLKLPTFLTRRIRLERKAWGDPSPLCSFQAVPPASPRGLPHKFPLWALRQPFVILRSPHSLAGISFLSTFPGETLRRFCWSQAYILGALESPGYRGCQHFPDCCSQCCSCFCLFQTPYTLVTSSSILLHSRHHHLAI